MNGNRERETGARAGFRKSFSLRAFIQGLVFVALVYLALAGWLWLKSDKTSDSIESRLASQTVLVNRSDITNTEAEIPRPPDQAEAITESASATEAAPLTGINERHELYKQTDAGVIPVRTSEGATVFQAFRRPFQIERGPDARPVISLGLVGYGLSKSASEAAVSSLPPEVSLALSPYTTAADYWTDAARDNGHEVWLTLPMESQFYPLDDTGPDTMLISAPERENQQKLNRLISSGKGFIGFIASENPDFMKNSSDMRPVIGSVFNHGLGFINTANYPGSVARSMALGLNAPYADSDLWIDESLSEADIQSSLSKLEELARARGYATGLFRPHSVSFKEILKWLQGFEDKGLVLAPLSAQADIQ